MTDEMVAASEFTDRSFTKQVGFQIPHMDIWVVICHLLLTVPHAISRSLTNKTHSRSHQKQPVLYTEEGRWPLYPTILECTGQGVLQLATLPGYEEQRQH